MVEEVRGYLSDMIDAIATKRYDDLQQITEFAPAAKALHISRIVRTLNYGGRLNETLIYKDSSIYPLHNKKYERENTSCSLTYEFYTDVDFEIFGLLIDDTAVVRAAFALAQSEDYSDIKNDAENLERLIRLAQKSAKTNERMVF